MSRYSNKNIKKSNSYKFGIFSEYIVILFLFFKGYRILKRRYKNNLGELDLVCKKSNLLIIVEVKGRKKNINIESILSENQKRRIINSTLSLVSANKKYQKLAIRFDLVIVQPYKLPLHLVGYWD